MVMLMLKRQNVPLDRDVIFLAEAGEEGSTRVGIQFMVNEHFPKIDAEYCLAEGGGVTRERGQGEVRVGADAGEDPARHRADRARPGRPRLGAAARQRDRRTSPRPWRRWRRGQPPVRLNDTTRAYFKRLAAISTPDEAKRYRDVSERRSESSWTAADEYFLDHEPRHASMLRTSISPNIIQGGYRINVIPSEAKATLDVRMHPDDDHLALPRAGAEGHQRSRRWRWRGRSGTCARQRQRAA